MRCKQRTAIILLGIVWLLAGVFLLNLGLRLIAEKVLPVSSVVIPFLAPYTGKEEAAVVLIVIGLAVGFFKGRYVLRRTAAKGVARVRSLAEPVHLFHVFGLRYLLLIALMMGLGMAMRFFALPSDIRGIVDVAVGSALIQGAMGYFRSFSNVADAQR